jgi:hypothetical protein
MRDAALLTRRLGEPDRLAEILAIAEALHARDVERSPRSADRLRLLGDPDDQTKYPQDWSHARFLRFMQETVG